MIDLRSDTVTKPTDAMRRAMASAEVGDDVYGEDPTVNLLQEKAAEIFGKEAALFVPTGSMGNQIAVKLHTKAGDEIIIEQRGHIFNYEMGAPSTLAGVMIRAVKSANDNGMLEWAEIESALHINQPYYACPTGLICLENTHNFGGGSVMSAAQTSEICERAHALRLPVHLDGARIFNASVALNESVAVLSKDCDSVQFCLSKGLGAPVGSMLLGAKDFIAEARVWRKRLGGGMRQVGVLAAAGLIALEESPKNLHVDHENAKRLAEGAANLRGVKIDAERVATNIVIFDVSETGKTSNQICVELKEQNILAIPFGNAIRMVTHSDVSKEDIIRTIEVLTKILGEQNGVLEKQFKMQDFGNYITNLDGKEIHNTLSKRNRNYSGADILLLFYEELLGLNLKKWNNPSQKTQETIANFDDQIFNGRTLSTWANGVHHIYIEGYKGSKKKRLASINFEEMIGNPEKLHEFGVSFPTLLKDIEQHLSLER